jgi:hypothetical protein
LADAAVGAIVCGAACYVRNWIRLGSPIFPYTLKLAGHVVFPGLIAPQELLVTVERWFVSSTSGWLVYPFHETMKGAVRYGSENGFGAVFAAGWLLFPWSAGRALWRRDWGAAGFLALLPASAFFFIAMHPTREPRYMIFLAAIAIAGLAYGLSGLRGAWRKAALWAWSFGIVWGLLGVLGYFGEDQAFLPAWKELRLTGHVDAHEYYRRQYGSLGEVWAALDARLSAGDVVVVNYGELMLPLAGTPPKARLFVVGRQASDFPETLWGSSDEDWLAQLSGVHARYLVIWSPPWYPDVATLERRAIARFADRFHSIGKWNVGGYGPAELYEVLPGAPALPRVVDPQSGGSPP